MNVRIAMVGVLFLLAPGCGKKNTKFTGSSDTPAPNSQTSTGDKGKPGDKNNKDADKPNWLNDPRYKHEKQSPAETAADPGGLPGKPGWGVSAPQGGWTPPGNPNPGGPANPGAVPPGNPGANVVPPGVGAQPPMPAGPAPQPAGSPVTGGKAVAEADMKNVWILIENRSGASGVMPSPQAVIEALVLAKSPAADLVRDGSIALTGARTRDSIWAYEKRALTQGGFVASQNGVENVTAAELTRRLSGR